MSREAITVSTANPSTPTPQITHNVGINHPND